MKRLCSTTAQTIRINSNVQLNSQFNSMVDIAEQEKLKDELGGGGG